MGAKQRYLDRGRSIVWSMVVQSNLEYEKMLGSKGGRDGR